MSNLELVVYTLITTHITIAAVTIFLHRNQAHKSVKLHPLISHFFRFWLWLTTGMATKEWVAIHRKHHAKCETEDDPHSPMFKGIWYMLFFGALPYHEETKNKETMKNYGQGTPDDWIENNVYKHEVFGVVILLIGEVVCFGWRGILVWFVQMYWIPFWAAGVINGIGHYFGYRTFSIKDTSSNILPIGIVIGGEELHNNHHAFPRSAKLSFKKYEFDIGWMYIKILEFLRLAKVVEVSAPFESKDGKLNISTAKGSSSAKMRLIKYYEDTVMNKIIESECDASVLDKFMSSQGCSFRKWWTRDKSILSQDAMHYLTDALQKSNNLKVVYELRDKLIEAWHGAGYSIQERISKLEAWCKDADAVGIACLDAFISYLRKRLPKNLS